MPIHQSIPFSRQSYKLNRQLRESIKSCTRKRKHSLNKLILKISPLTLDYLAESSAKVLLLIFPRDGFKEKNESIF